MYTNLKGNKSYTVCTAWAMLALIEAGQVLKKISTINILHFEEQLVKPDFLVRVSRTNKPLNKL